MADESLRWWRRLILPNAIRRWRKQTDNTRAAYSLGQNMIVAGLGIQLASLHYCCWNVPLRNRQGTDPDCDEYGRHCGLETFGEIIADRPLDIVRCELAHPRQISVRIDRVCRRKRWVFDQS